MKSVTYHGGESSHLIEVVWTLVALAGGVAKYLHETYKKNRPFRFLELIGKAVISSFSGLTAGNMMLTMTANNNLVFVSVAIGGWMGADFLDFLMPLLKRKWGGGDGNPAT